MYNAHSHHLKIHITEFLICGPITKCFLKNLVNTKIFRTLDTFLYLTIPQQEVVFHSYDNWKKTDSRAHTAESIHAEIQNSAWQNLPFPSI